MSSGISNVASLLGRGAVSESRQKAEPADDVFGMFLGRNLVQTNQNTKEDSSYGEQAQVTYDKDVKISSAKPKLTKTGRSISKKLEESPGKVREPTKNVDKSTENVDESTDSMAGFHEKIKEVLMSQLEVTEEELVKAMEELGIGFASLMDIPNLTNLVMELAGTEDIGSLLLSEEFQNIYADIGTLTQELLAELGMTQEELDNVLQQMTLEALEPETNDEMIQVEMLNKEEIPESSGYQVKQEPVKEQVVVIEQDADPESVQGTKQGDSVPVMNEEARADAEDTSRQDQTQDGNLLQQKQEKEQEEQLKTQVTVQTTQTTQTQAGAEVTQTVQQAYVDVEDIIRQVSEFTRVSITQTESTIEMQLNPAHLGKVYLQVTARDGVITAQLAAQNEAVKEVLESQAALLKENMNQQGLKVEAVEVTIASHEFERNLEGNGQNEAEQDQSGEGHKRTRRNITLDSLDDLEGLMSEEERLAAKIMRDNGNSMDLNA